MNHSLRQSRARAATVRLAFVLVAGGIAMGTLASCGGGGDTPAGPVVETVARVDVSAPATVLAPNQTVQLTATARNGNGGAIGGVESLWSSLTPAVATVDASGVVTALTPGNATIRATMNGVAGTIAVTVTSGAGVIATLVTSAVDVEIELGQTTQATVVAVDFQGNPIPLGSRAVTWSTSNQSVAIVSSSGILTGVGVGTVDVQVAIVDGAVTWRGGAPITITGIAGAPSSVDIFMTPDRFQPFQAVVKQGGTVRWMFNSLDHNVIWDRRLAGAPADIPVTANAVVSRTFPTVGVFDYVCTLHPGMDGQIIVSP